MDKHCTSLEISKQLKEAGWKKETEFVWLGYFAKKRILNQPIGDPQEMFWIEKFNDPRKSMQVEERDSKFINYPAPLATEILEELPYNSYITKGSIWRVDFNEYHEKSISLCDCLAKIWMYLKKNNLLGGSNEKR